jgi:asparagine synthase (glutamine-hydrolysing)
MRGVQLTADGWTRDGNAIARGRAFDPDGRPVAPEAAFADCESADAVAETAAELTGFFAAVVRVSDARLLVCDLARSIPLYFTVEPQSVVSDVATTLAPMDPATYDPTAASEFALTRYVTRGETLVPDVKAVHAGEVVSIPDGRASDVERERYARYRPTTDIGAGVETGVSASRTRAELLDELASTMSRVFDRVARVAGGRTVLVPLSGGWDSRLVATELAARDADVVAFTFGAHGHSDVEVSRDVADALGIRWEWAAYTTDSWHAWYHSSMRRQYHGYAFNFDSLPFLAEWPAVHELLAGDRVPDDSLVCPGHTVATPSERVPDAWVPSGEGSGEGDTAAPVTSQEVIDHILETHYTLWEWEDPAYRERFADRIRSTVDLPTRGLSGPEAAAVYEQWEWDTRMTTFTNADCRLYEWFGLDWWLPLWDRDFVDFWSSVPLSHRHRKSLQREYCRRRFADVADVETDRASRTDRDWTPSEQVRRTFETRPERPLIEREASSEAGFESWLGAQAVPDETVESRGRYPLRWYGIYPKDAEERFGSAKNLYALRTLAELGLVSFDPPRAAVPLDGLISLPPV